LPAKENQQIMVKAEAVYAGALICAYVPGAQDFASKLLSAKIFPDIPR
jgi:hypothetical protein